MYLKTQKFFILGVSKSGFSVAKYALGMGAECYIYEELKNPSIDNSIAELINDGAKYISQDQIDKVIQIIDVLVISPGVPINHEVAIKAKKAGKRIIGELEFGFLQFSPTIVAVTGTNGKTTTVSLIDAILKEAGLDSKLVGNVGVPVTKMLPEINKDSVCVTEVSSFQLESVNAFCPHISCVLNLSPDHLERHYSMENYIFLKKRIFKNQRESEYTVLNYDDKIVNAFYTETRGHVIWVSTVNKVEGAYISNGKIYFFDEYIADVSDLKLIGEHNVYNVLFAIVCSALLGVSVEIISNSIKNFKGVKHRIETVCEKGGITYINDSKATNTASTMSAVQSMEVPTVLILGGSEKGEEYHQLFAKIKNSKIKHVVLTGDSRFNMLTQAESIGFKNLSLTPNFFDAVKIASLFAKEGENVLLSPACASFDNFKSYVERGEAFVKAVENL